MVVTGKTSKILYQTCQIAPCLGHSWISNLNTIVCRTSLPFESHCFRHFWDVGFLSPLIQLKIRHLLVRKSYQKANLICQNPNFSRLSRDVLCVVQKNYFHINKVVESFCLSQYSFRKRVVHFCRTQENNDFSAERKCDKIKKLPQKVGFRCPF